VSVDTLSRYAQYCYLAEQPLDWALFGSLLVFLTQFVRLQTGFLFGAKLKMS
jgi:hypothetical protein